MAAVAWIHKIHARYSFSLSRGAACSVCAFVVFLSLGPAGTTPQPDTAVHLGPPSTTHAQPVISDRVCVIKWRATYAAHYERMERRRAEDLARETEATTATAGRHASDGRAAIRLASGRNMTESRDPTVQAEEAVAFWERARADSERRLEKENESAAVDRGAVARVTHQQTSAALPPTWSICLALGLSLPLGLLAAAARRGAPSSRQAVGGVSGPVLRIRAPSFLFETPAGIPMHGDAVLRPLAGWTDALVAAAAAVILVLAAKCLIVPGAWAEISTSPLRAIAALWGG